MVKKWGLYWVRLNPVTGSEQAGTRPCLVVSNDIVNEILPVVTILPLSSVKPHSRIYPTEVSFSKEMTALPHDSVVMVHQIRTISKSRILGPCGHIDNAAVQQDVSAVMRDYFEL